MSREERAKRFAKIWWKSRADAKVSQEYLAMELGVSKKTIQNWEKGVSSPTFFQGNEWFRALGLNPMPYYLEYVYPDSEGISSQDDDERIAGLLLRIVADLPTVAQRQLLYLLYADHGSTPVGMLQMITAHLQTPLRERLSHAMMIAHDYNIAHERGNLTDASHIQPDMEILDRAIKSGYKSILEDKNGYSLSH